MIYFNQMILKNKLRNLFFIDIFNKINLISILRNIIFIFIFPFIFLPKIGYSTDFLKAFFLETVSLILCTFLIIDSFLKNKKKEISLAVNYVFVVFFVYIFFLLISCINSAVPMLSFFGNIERPDSLVFIFCLFIFSFVVGSIFKQRKDWDMLFVIFIFSSILFTIITFCSLSFNNFFSGIGIHSISGLTIGNSSYAGIYLVFAFFISLGVYAYTEIKIYKIIAILGFMASLVNPNISGFLVPGGKIVGEARTAFYSILVGFFIFVLYVIFRKISSVLWKRIFAGFLIAVSLFVMFFITFYKPNVIYQNISQNAGPNRLIFWDIAMKGFKERPIFGWGNNTFHLVYAKYFNPVIGTSGYLPEYFVDRAHNVFFDELVSTGVLGTISLFLLYGVLLFGLVRKAFNEQERERYLYMALFVGLVSFLIQGIMVFQTIIGWFVVALLVAFVANFCFLDRSFYLKINYNFKYQKFTLFFLAFLCFIGIFYLVIKPYKISLELDSLKYMDLNKRLVSYKEIDKAYYGNTKDLSEVFLPFYLGTLRDLSKGSKLSSNNKKLSIYEVDKVVDILNNGLRKENYMDMRLLITTIGFYSILVSLSEGQAKQDYYNKGMHYVDLMFKLSPQFPFNEKAKNMMNFPLKYSLEKQ